MVSFNVGQSLNDLSLPYILFLRPQLNVSYKYWGLLLLKLPDIYLLLNC